MSELKVVEQSLMYDEHVYDNCKQKSLNEVSIMYRVPLALAVLASSMAFKCLCFFSLSSFNILSRLNEMATN